MEKRKGGWNGIEREKTEAFANSERKKVFWKEFPTKVPRKKGQ